MRNSLLISALGISGLLAFSSGMYMSCNTTHTQAPQTVLTDIEWVNPDLPDFAAYTDVKAKKRAFFSFLEPLISQANHAVLLERQQILNWQDNAQENPQELARLLKKYRVSASDKTQQLNELAEKVQTIPPSLVMAQAANESAWGTSRFSRLGNNLFGQWCFTQGCGIVPSSRNSGASHEVAKFSSPAESVASYIRNLNSHPSYEPLRRLRTQELQQQGYSSGNTLAAGLLKYSERGEEYVKEIRAMIRHNQLSRLDNGEKFDAGQEAEKNQG